LDDDADFMAFLRERAFNLTSDNGDDAIPAGLDLRDYHLVDPGFFANRDQHGMGDYDAFVFDTALQVGIGACKAIYDGEDPKDAYALHRGMTSVRFQGEHANHTPSGPPTTP
jgi:hypothetical protein